jgi:purine-binding chemotaxis protein CheW
MNEKETKKKDKITPELLHARAQLYAKYKEEIKLIGELKEYLGFRLGEEKYLIEITLVEEVLKPLCVSKIPRSPECLLGTMNIRGRIVLISDLGVFLNLQRTEVKKETKIVVLKAGKDLTGFPVDEVYESMTLDTGTLQRPISIAKGIAEKSIEGLFKLDEECFIWLKIENILLDLTKRLSQK